MNRTKRTRIKMPPARTKRVRRCLNPECLSRVAGGKMVLKGTWNKEYARLTCPKCGAISIFNPISRVSADLKRDVYVQRKDRVEHIRPRLKVLRI